MAMMEMTTSNSIKVNALWLRHAVRGLQWVMPGCVEIMQRRDEQIARSTHFRLV
jgi:hypothetical protein